MIAVAHGTIELPTDRQALVTPHIEGRVRRIHVRPSQQVAAGDVLVELDSLQLRSVQLELLQTWTQARLVEQSLHRLEQLGSQGVTSKRQMWEKKSELQTLSLRIESLKRQLALFGVEPEAIEKTGAGRSDAARRWCRVGADGSRPRSGGRSDRKFQRRARTGCRPRKHPV